MANNEQRQDWPEEKSTPPPTRERGGRVMIDSYHFEFRPTGCDPIDSLLHAVARAGKAFHNTAQWQEEVLSSGSPQEWIQEAADKAARAFQPDAEPVEGDPWRPSNADIDRLREQIVQLRDPGNWRVRYKGPLGRANGLLDHQLYRPEYVGPDPDRPHETQEDDDGTG